LNNIQPPTPHDRLILARTYSVDHWVIPALSALCEREATLSLDEARQMDIEDVVLVATVREGIRSHNLQVDAAEIPRRVEAAQAGKPVNIGSVDVSPAVSTSMAVEQESSSVDQGPGTKDRGTEESVGEVLVSLVAVGLKLVWVDGVDNIFQQKQRAPEQTEEPPQPMDDFQTEEIARRKAEVENVRRKVEEAMHSADGRTMRKWELQVNERSSEEARAADLEAKAEDAERKAEAAEREAEAARVLVLETVSGIEKAAAGEVSRLANRTAKQARNEADSARAGAAYAAQRANRSWV
jgi:hypothetical protein